jgi:hypothetical protein
VVAVGNNDYWQLNVGGWNLLLAVPASQCLLTISSLGGSVTTPGEGAFIYSPGRVIDLVAEPDADCRFVHWTGGVGSIADVGAASTTIIMDGDHAIRADFAPVDVTELSVGISPRSGPAGTEIWVRVYNPQKEQSTEEVEVIFYFDDTIVYSTYYPVSYDSWTHIYVCPDIWPGQYTIKALHVAFNITGTTTFTVLPGTRPPEGGVIAGDWIEYEYALRPADHTGPEWLKLEFISVKGTRASVNVTLGMSDRQELRDTVPVDLGAGGGEAFGLAGFTIPPNLTTGDSVHISAYGNATIEGETAKTYAGARRDAVYTSFSQDEVQITYYWDKETGVMVETSTTSGDLAATAKAIETNMWEATTARMPWWLWMIIAVAVAAAASVVYRLRRKKTPSTPTSPPEGS